MHGNCQSAGSKLLGSHYLSDRLPLDWGFFMPVIPIKHLRLRSFSVNLLLNTRRNKNVTPAKQAKSYGTTLSAVSEFSGYNLDTLRRYHAGRQKRFKALCVACVCDELGLNGQELRDYVKLKRSIEGK